MIFNTSTVPPAHDMRYLHRLISQIRDTFQQVNSRRFAQDRVLLKSPDGGTWAVSVDNSGVVSATAVNPNALD